MHPLYPVARGLVRRPVICHHINGRNYSGILQSVTPSGVYLLSRPVVVSGTAEIHASVAETAIALKQSVDASPIYSPAAYFGFGALTGFTLGALATAPYYGYGYGYGYGYPGYY